MAQTTKLADFPGGISASAPTQVRVDKEQFTSAEFMALEWAHIWTRTWLFAGLISDLEDAGDYFVYELARESIVVMRNDEGELSAFYNVCQHRGNRLFANESGWVAEVVCPYHGWRYTTEGTLSHVPDAERFVEDISVEQRSLKPVRLQVWAGLVWINMDMDAAPLEQYLGSFMQDLAPFQLQNKVLTNHQTVALDTNWKTVRDNFLEQYHVDFIHPQHASLVDCCNSVNNLYPYGHSNTKVEGYTPNPRYPLPEQVPDYMLPMLEGLKLNPKEYFGRVLEVRKAVQARKRELGKNMDCGYDTLSDDELSDVWQYDFFPNLFMTLQAEEVSIYGPRPHPTDPNKCFFDKWTLQLSAEAGNDLSGGISLHPGLKTSKQAARPQHSVFEREDVLNGTHSLTMTFDQDIAYLPDMQAGMHSRGFSDAMLNQDEARVQHFHNWLAAWIEGVPTELS
jgi:phenylpropionate dioxygenase-like ring-hydroxylating dioxygenase large terminal subunit